MTETKMGNLLVHSLGTPLVKLAFFFPFFWLSSTLSPFIPSTRG